MERTKVDAFWEDARVRAGLAPVRGYMGVGGAEALPPPAWSFGATPEVADELAELVLAGIKTATASALWDYEAEEEELPEPGDLAIIVDGSGEPRALIETTSVMTVPFNEVDADHAWAEGEGDRTLATWRQIHRQFFTDHACKDREFREDMPVVLETFRSLVPKPPKHPKVPEDASE